MTTFHTYIGDELAQRVAARVPQGAPDECWKWQGYCRPSGYGMFRFRGKNLYAHRLAYQVFIGPIPEGLVVDHACHNRSCCNPAHLRAVTQKQNTENFGGLSRHNTSGYRGVTLHQHSGLWMAQVWHDGKHFVTYHRSAAVAGEAARKMRLSLHSHNDLDRGVA